MIRLATVLFVVAAIIAGVFLYTPEHTAPSVPMVDSAHVPDAEFELVERTVQLENGSSTTLQLEDDFDIPSWR